MIASVRDNDELLLNAYCDGELDPASATGFERRLAENEPIKTQYARLLWLHRDVRSLPQYEMPAVLRARIQSTLDADRPVQVGRPGQVGPAAQVRRLHQRGWSFRALAAAAGFGAGISSS